MAAIYAAILVKHTNYSNTQQERAFFETLYPNPNPNPNPNPYQERAFFETLYDFSARVLFTINDRKRWHAKLTRTPRGLRRVRTGYAYQPRA